MGIPSIFLPIFRIPILKVKFKPGNSQTFDLKYACLLQGVPLISGIAHFIYICTSRLITLNVATNEYV